MEVQRDRVRAPDKRGNSRRALGLLALVLGASAAIAVAQDTRQPPFDFSDAYYLANGINPANIIDRVGGTCPASDKPACSVVDSYRTRNLNRRDIRVLSTTGGFDHEGNPLCYNIFGMVMPDTFTNDAAGEKAMGIANDFEASSESERRSLEPGTVKPQTR